MIYQKKIEEVDYRFRDDLHYPEVELSVLELLSGPFCGILYCYGKTNIETIDDENGVLKFEFCVFNRNEEERKALAQNKEFIQHIGEVLNSIILDDMGEE